MKTPWLLLAAVLALACASSAPRNQEGLARPQARKFVAPDLESDASTWIGPYEGLVDVYISGEAVWTRGSAIQLFVQPDEGRSLRILGHVVLSAGQRSFYLAGIGPPVTNALYGERVEEGSLYTTRYEYSFIRAGDTITGTVKSSRARSGEEVYEPEDEWIFEVQRRSGPALR